MFTNVPPPVNTETYHAQYRVLEAFSFFNIILSMCSSYLILSDWYSSYHSVQSGRSSSYCYSWQSVTTAWVIAPYGCPPSPRSLGSLSQVRGEASFQIRSLPGGRGRSGRSDHLHNLAMLLRLQYQKRPLCHQGGCHQDATSPHTTRSPNTFSGCLIRRHPPICLRRDALGTGSTETHHPGGEAIKIY